MISSDGQVRKLFKEMDKHGDIDMAALKSGMCRKTAKKYLKKGRLPSELKVPRSWRTRDNPFEDDWAEIEAKLKDAPELEAKALFEDLNDRKKEGEKYDEGQLRTFQRRVREWRALSGPDKNVFFPQAHRPGEALQTDFTSGNKLGITIQGEPFDHLICHPVLPYSNWEWGTICQSESMAAMSRGVQETVFRLGKVPKFHQTDNSTAATHRLADKKRGFNDDYVNLIKHLGMTPRTIEVGEKHQNGDVEAAHGVLKRRLKQHLILRGSRDFPSREAYEEWVQGVMSKANELRTRRFEEELAVMSPLRAQRLPDFKEIEALVTRNSTVRIYHNVYSVPSRLIGENLRIRAYEDRLDMYFRSRFLFSAERLVGKRRHKINYRHIIWSLVQKPGAFERYQYKEDLFPSVIFRKCYDALSQSMPSRKADLEYLRILYLAATTLESEVETAVELLLESSDKPSIEKVKALTGTTESGIPNLEIPCVTLSSYDGLLEASGGVN